MLNVLQNLLWIKYLHWEFTNCNGVEKCGIFNSKFVKKIKKNFQES